MKYSKLIGIAIAGILTGCATQPDYRAAEERGDYGYYEQKLEENRYRITFTGDHTTDRAEVQDYVLLRAAELTVEKGFERFRTVQRDVDKDERFGTRDVIAPGFGYTYCDYRGCFYTTSIRGPGFVGSTLPRERDQYIAIMEIVMGPSASAADNPDVYSARDVINNLRPQLRGGN